MPTDLELQPLAPEYRYYTVDLLTNEILAEIPFSGVSWERALKSAGAFSGKIPVIPAMRHLNLYETTMPGKTALFVVRNNICVWGGIIWTREYNVIDRNLSISASEFTSYFYHRKIWKTWNHQFGGTLQVASGTGKIVFENGSNVNIFPGSSVHIEFYNPSDFKYNGYYRVESSPAPTQAGFSIVGGMSIADIQSVEIISGVAYITTKTKHGFNTGDLIDLDTSYGAPFDGVHEITVPAGPDTNLLTFPLGAPGSTNSGTYGDLIRTVDTGTAVRPLPDGVFADITVTVRSDTYDYIRTLIDSVFSDFVGTEFPNTYIEPGISYGLNIVKKALAGGFATITTDNDHHLAVGQAVQIQDVGPNFDGEFEVVETPAPNVFMYAAGGTLAPTTVAPLKSDILAISLLDQTAKISTSSPHGYVVGNNVDVFVGFDYPDLNGSQVIESVPSAATFTYSVQSKNTIPSKLLTNGTASVNGTSVRVISSKIDANTVTLTTATDHGFALNNQVTVDHVNRTVPIIEKSLDAPNSSATFQTSKPHRFQPNLVQTTQYINLINKPSARRGVTTGFGGLGALSLGADPGADVYAVLTNGSSRGNTGLYINQTFTVGVATLSAGVTYTLSAEIYGSASSAILYVAGPGVVNAGAISPDVPMGAFTRTSVTFTTTTSGSVTMYILNGNTVPSSGSNYVGVRDILLEVGLTPHAYFDGSTTPQTLGQANSWMGVVDDSPSIHGWAATTYVEGLSDISKITRLSATTAQTTLTTEQAHNFAIGQSIEIPAMLDEYIPTSKTVSANVATVGLTTTHNIAAGSTINLSGLEDSYSITSKMLSQGLATLTTSVAHNMKVNDPITVSGLSDSGSVVSLTAENNIATLTLSAPHNFLEGQQITVSGVGVPFNGTFSVLSVTDTRVFYEIDNGNAIILPARAAGTVFTADSYFNGEFTVSAVSSTSISYVRGGQNVVSQSVTSGSIVTPSILNGAQIVATASGQQFTFAKVANNMATATVPVAVSPESVQAMATQQSIYVGGAYTIQGVTRNTVVISKAITTAIASKPVDGVATRTSLFNGFRGITATPSVDEFKAAISATSNVLEETSTNTATATAYNIFNGTFYITGVNPDERTFTYSRAWPNIEETPVQSWGTSVVAPMAIVSSFGPFPGNADINMQYSTLGYSGTNIEPVAYRGFELKTVGEALDSYSDSIDGFEYRVDCTYDLETKSFTKTFVLVPINFPNPPADGEVSPLSRFGADKLVFEYPGGSIMSMTVAESAEDSATRFFAVGASELGPDVGPNISIASNEDLLSGSNGDEDFRRWPLLDETQKVDGVDDEAVLFAYAERYLAENRPPDAKLNITVNGSLAPIVGTYSPGDWCALIIKDDFVLMRLQSDLEPRDDVILRKIDGYKVEVPDGTTFPEKVTLTLVPEWEVDKIGKPSI
jgi:hypothetical protein